MSDETPRTRNKTKLPASIRVLAGVGRLLDTLTPEDQSRVIRWLAETRGVTLPAPACKAAGYTDTGAARKDGAG